jgi:hypothetical protein
VPRIPELPTDWWNLSLAAKYLDKSFNLFDETALAGPQRSEIRSWISAEIERRFGAGNNNQDGTAGPD